MDRDERESFLDAARLAAELVRRPEVTQRWTDESACAEMSIGGLACHLASQVTNTVRLVDAPESTESPIPLIEHYVRAAWVGSDLDAEVNVGIREGSDAEAVAGPAALLTRLDDHLARLPVVLAAADLEAPLLIPWQSWSLTVADWLVTRMMEIVVHSDDLAASIGRPTPEFPDDVITPVLALLTRVAVMRHGQAAMVRALSRPQRAPDVVSAF